MLRITDVWEDKDGTGLATLNDGLVIGPVDDIAYIAQRAKFEETHRLVLKNELVVKKAEHEFPGL